MSTRHESPDQIIRIRWWNSFVFRFVVLNSSIVLSLFGILLFQSHTSNREQVTRRFSQVLETIVSNGAPLIDGDSLSAIRGNSDAEKQEFKNTRKILATLRVQNQIDSDAIYILRPHETRSGVYRFVVMLQRRTFIGDEYRPPPHIERLYQKALAGKSIRSPIYEDDHGSFISGVAPIRGSDGNVTALLQADIRLVRYLEAVNDATRQMMLIGFAVLCALILLGIYMRRRLSTRIGQLMKGTLALNNQEFATRIRLSSHDELGVLARSINVALEHLQERAEMLKFLPEHTQKMISRVLEGGAEQVELTEARNVDVAVLETDIRGFTALSEKLEPSETIALINRYIRLQAEKILHFGGSIDKYMGDAVLVVFEGEYAAQRAFVCAREILTEIEVINRETATPVWVGAGLTYGPVVMGNMGCDARMEHTVIGPTVNLAARLCSAAQPGQLVVLESIIRSRNPIASTQTIPTESGQQEIAATKSLDISAAFHHALDSEHMVDEIICKGFSQPIRVARFSSTGGSA